MARELKSKKRRQDCLTPNKLFEILNEMIGGEKAKEKYRELTGEEPPEEDYEEK